MIKLIIIFLCFIIYPSLCFSEDQMIFKITDEESIMQFTDADEIWSDIIFDRSKFEKRIKEYLKSTKSSNFLDYAGDDTENVCKYIVKNLSKYNIQYAGVIWKGKKLIYCIMCTDETGCAQSDSFSVYIMDGGCSVIKVIYDPINEDILLFRCNGVA